MISENYDFQISTEELAYLKRLVSEDEGLTDMINSVDPLRSDKFTIQLNRDAVEKLRGLLTERLAIVGFDKNYSLTKEGEMLETLIDRFYF